jgi:hypothetical protein
VQKKRAVAFRFVFFSFLKIFSFSLNDDPGRDTIAAFSDAPLRRVNVSLKIPFHVAMSPVSCWLSPLIDPFRRLGNGHYLHCSLDYGLFL